MENVLAGRKIRLTPSPFKFKDLLQLVEDVFINYRATRQRTLSLPQIEVFRQCCKICVASKLFSEANALMTFSLQLSERTHGLTHPCHAQTLLIYGFYLLNMSNIYMFS